MEDLQTAMLGEPMIPSWHGRDCPPFVVIVVAVFVYCDIQITSSVGISDIGAVHNIVS